MSMKFGAEKMITLWEWYFSYLYKLKVKNIGRSYNFE